VIAASLLLAAGSVFFVLAIFRFPDDSRGIAAVTGTSPELPGMRWGGRAWRSMRLADAHTNASFGGEVQRNMR
jgi:hypothetical protein